MGGMDSNGSNILRPIPEKIYFLCVCFPFSPPQRIGECHREKHYISLYFFDSVYPLSR